MKFIAALMFILMITACNDSDTGSNHQSNYRLNKSEIGCEVGKTAPNFKALLSDNTLFELSAYRGKVVMIEFWGTWCSYCAYARPLLRIIHDMYKSDTNYVMLGISINDTKEKWEEYILEKQLNWLQTQNTSGFGIDPKVLFCIEGIPTVLIIDKWGVIRSALNPTTTIMMSNKIDELLKE